MIPLVPKQKLVLQIENKTNENKMSLNEWLNKSLPSFQCVEVDPKEKYIVSSLKEFSLRIKCKIIFLFFYFYFIFYLYLFFLLLFFFIIYFCSAITDKTSYWETLSIEEFPFPKTCISYSSILVEKANSAHFSSQVTQFSEIYKQDYQTVESIISGNIFLF